MNQAISLRLKKHASEFRSKCGITSNELIPLRSILNKMDIVAVFRPLNESLSGMAIKIGNDEKNEAARFILVDTSQAIGRQNFTICHEIYHLYYQNNFVSAIDKTGLFDNSNKEEYNADIFASFLLLPEDGIREMIPDAELKKNTITLKTILKIEQYFRCSRTVLLRRLKAIGVIDNNYFDLYKANVIRGAIEYGYDISLYQPDNRSYVISNYGEFARDAFEKDLISESHYYSLLHDLGINIQKIGANGQDNEEY